MGEVKNKLKIILAGTNVSQQELAKIVGVTKATISNIINNKFPTSMEIGFKIADYLNISFLDIFYYEREDGSIFDYVKEDRVEYFATPEMADFIRNMRKQMNLLTQEHGELKKTIEDLAVKEVDK